MNNLEQQFRDLMAEANREAARDPQRADEIRHESLMRARDLVEDSRRGGLRLVNRTPLPEPGIAGRRKAGLR